MTNVDLVTRKLATLDEHLRRLRERRPDDLATFRADTLLQDAVAPRPWPVGRAGSKVFQVTSPLRRGRKWLD